MTTVEASRGWEANAAEFGALSKQGRDVRLALLVACSVENNGKGRPKKNNRSFSGKVDGAVFAKQAGASAPRVLRHLAAWDKFAAAAGLPIAAELTPADASTLTITEAQAEHFKPGILGTKTTDAVTSNPTAVADALDVPVSDLVGESVA